MLCVRCVPAELLQFAAPVAGAEGAEDWMNVLLAERAATEERSGAWTTDDTRGRILERIEQSVRWNVVAPNAQWIAEDGWVISYTIGRVQG